MKKFTSLLQHAYGITIATSTIIILSIVGYIVWETHQHKDIARVARQERKDMAERIWQAKSENFLNVVRDNAAWDELRDFATMYNSSDVDSSWLDDNFGYMLDSYDASMVAIFDKNGNILYSKIAEGYDDFDFFALDFIILGNDFKEKGLANFFVYQGNTLMHFFGATITSSDDNDHRLPAQGYLLLSREISDDIIEDYRISVGALYIGISQTDSIDANNKANTDKRNITISQDFSNYTHKHEAYMYSVFENSIEEYFSKMVPVFGAFALLVLIVMAVVLLFMRNRITKPLGLVSRSLSSSNTAPIQPLRNLNDEFGQIAGMLDEFFQQQEEVRVQNETLRQQSDEILSINESLNDQKNQLSEVNRQLTDSIHYASRIQLSTVSPADDLMQMFPDSMIVYMPRDIVSGDWYYVTARRNSKIVIEADCTGHGVPGSLLSMLGISAVKDIINAMDINNEPILPVTILERMRITVKSTLKQSNDDIMSMNDGMDMSIGIFNANNTMLQFAGANQSLTILRESQIIKIRGNRMPIGNYVKERRFQGEEVPLQSGDAIFFMSDGIKDQTNRNLEKFKSKRLDAFLIKNEYLPLPELGYRLEATIKAWKGKTRQVDDITMVGIRV